MTGRWRDVPIRVHSRDGQTQIGEIVDVVGLEPVQLPGGVAYVDPATPWRPPSLIIVEGNVAAEVLAELWGTESVDLTLAGADGQLDVRDAGPGLQDLAALGTARWLERWQPCPLDPGLLRLDVLAAQARCQELLEPDDESAPELDAAALGALVAEAEIALASAGSGSTATSVVPDWVGTLGRTAAVAAATTTTLELAGRASADWDRVPAGTISRAESAVHWSVDERSGGTTLHVVAAAAVLPPRHPPTAVLALPSPARELRFRLYVPGWPLPLVEGELLPVGEAGAWAGAVGLSTDTLDRIDQTGPQQVLVDVALPGLPVPPRTGSSTLRARARRWSARCVMSGRLAGAVKVGQWSTALAAQAGSAGRQAVTLWQALGEDARTATIGSWLEDPARGRLWPIGLAERRAILDDDRDRDGDGGGSDDGRSG